jgi:tetratricopeptide (TPR) repeat protein
LAQLQGAREKVEAARRIKESAEKAASLDPNSDYAWHILGRWHQGMAGANSLLLGLAKIIYGDIPAASNEQALSYFQKAIALRPDRLIHTIELGRTYAQMGRREEARQWLEKGLAMPNRDFDDVETKLRARVALKKL